MPTLSHQYPGPLQGARSVRRSKITEVEWLNSPNPESLIEHLQTSSKSALIKHYPNYPRKFRLVACACVQHIWSALRDERSRQAVQTAARYADGLVGKDQLREAAIQARAVEDALFGTREVRAAWAARAARLTAEVDPWWVLRGTCIAVGQVVFGWKRARESEERCRQADLLREILGNPFHPVDVDSRWLRWQQGTVRRLAETIYAEDAFDVFPVLADALEEAGCGNIDILNHCRGPGPHGRGCWVLDRLTGRG